MACKFEAARLPIDFKYGDVVAALIATVEETTVWVEIETARIVTASPFLAQVG